MDFEMIVKDISELNLNLYDLSIYTCDGIRTHRFQPCNNCNNSYSVAKVFVMTALGMLWDEKKIRMTDPLSMYFDIPSSAGLGWKLATIEHAVTHRLGFDEGFLDIDTEDTTTYPTDDYLSMVFSHPLTHIPGTHVQYSDAAYYLLSRLFSIVANENIDTFLNRRLLKPLRFREAAWSRCPLEYPVGATGLYISSEDMVKLGALYLEDGMWNGQRILSNEWVERVISREYEFHTMTSSGLIGKGGMYGQMLVFSKEQNFAVACHAHEESDRCQLLIEYMDGLK